MFVIKSKLGRYFCGTEVRAGNNAVAYLWGGETDSRVREYPWESYAETMANNMPRVYGAEVVRT